MSNVRLDPLNVAAPSLDRIGPSQELIDLPTDRPSFGEHLQRATTSRDEADSPDSQPSSRADDRPRADDVANDHSAPRDSANDDTVRESDSDSEQHEPITDSETPPKEVTDRQDEDPPEDETQDQESNAATNESVQVVSSESGAANAVVEQKTTEEQVVSEVAEEEIVKETTPRSESDGSSKPSTQPFPEPAPPSETGSTEDVSTSTKVLPTDHVSTDPSNAAKREVADVSLKSADPSKKGPTENAVALESNPKDGSQSTPASPIATKETAVTHSLVSSENEDGDSKGQNESGQHTSRRNRHAKETPLSQGHTP